MQSRQTIRECVRGADQCIDDAGFAGGVAGVRDDAQFGLWPSGMQRVRLVDRTDHVVTALHDHARYAGQTLRVTHDLVGFEKTVVHEIVALDARQAECGECSVEAIVNIAPFIQLAAKTKGVCDDAYFKLLKLMYYKESIGDSIIFEGGGNISNWMTMDGCDFCSYSELGGGAIVKMYQQRDKVNACGNLFKEKSTNYSRYFQPEDSETHYGYSKDSVIAELNKILTSVKLSAEERKSLEGTLKKIKSGVGIQFNCKNSSCTYNMN